MYLTAGQSLPNPHKVTIWQIFGRAHTVRMLVRMIIHRNLVLDSPCEIPHEVTNFAGAEISSIQTQKKIKETVAFRVRYMYQAQALLTPARSLWL